MRTPLVSVLITSYNREKYIGDTIRSVLNSSVQDFEVIICDDCSNDNTYEVAQSFVAVDDRVRVYQNNINLGDYKNRNQVATYAKGKYLKYLDSDDMIYHHGLQVMLESMEAHPDAGLGLSFNTVDDLKPYPYQLTSTESIKREFLVKSLTGVGPSASIIKREVFERIGGFSGEQFIGDTDLWLRIIREYPLVLFQPALIWWRQHPEQQIEEENKNLNIILRRIELRKKHIKQSYDVGLLTIEEYKLAKNKLRKDIIKIFLRKILGGDFKYSWQLYKALNAHG